MIPSPRILPASSLQISLRVRRFPSGSQGAQTGPRRLAGGGAAGCAETGAHVPLSPTLQGESPSAVNFSASSHSSQPVPRQAIFCLIPRSRRASQPLARHMRSGGICLQEVSATPPRSPAALQALLFQSVQCQFIPRSLALPGYQPPNLPLQQRHIPKGEIHRTAVDAQGITNKDSSERHQDIFALEY